MRVGKLLGSNYNPTLRLPRNVFSTHSSRHNKKSQNPRKMEVIQLTLFEKALDQLQVAIISGHKALRLLNISNFT